MIGVMSIKIMMLIAAMIVMLNTIVMVMMVENNLYHGRKDNKYAIWTKHFNIETK